MEKTQYRNIPATKNGQPFSGIVTHMPNALMNRSVVVVVEVPSLRMGIEQPNCVTHRDPRGYVELLLAWPSIPYGSAKLTRFKIPTPLGSLRLLDARAAVRAWIVFSTPTLSKLYSFLKPFKVVQSWTWLFCAYVVIAPDFLRLNISSVGRHCWTATNKDSSLVLLYHCWPHDKIKFAGPIAEFSLLKAYEKLCLAYCVLRSWSMLGTQLTGCS
jgi:hypothetical protein